MGKPRLLDLGCCAGGASYGLDKASFDVTGLDIKPQKHYPYKFILGDMLTHPLEGYDAYWCSPPCQGDSPAAIQWRKLGKQYPALIAPMRERLKATGKPWIIENVPEAPLNHTITLTCATFGLMLRRTRSFECNFDVPFTLQSKDAHSNFRMGRPPKEGECITPVGHFSGVERVRLITGFAWMNQGELAQAIPWQYSEFLGKYLMQAVMEQKKR